MDESSATGRRSSSWPTCPFVDRNDNRCTSRFSLGRIDQAFSVCFGSYRACPMYHRMVAEAGQSNQHHHLEGGDEAASEASDPPRRHTPDRLRPAPTLISVTAHGRALPLRPTGT